MDVLKRITDTIEGSEFKVHRMKPGTRLSFACIYTAAFHVVFHGECLIQCETSGHRVVLQRGDIIFFSRGQDHTLTAETSEETTADTLVMSGRYRFPAGPLHPFFHVLPQWFHLPAHGRAPSDPIQPLISVLAGEYERADASHVVLSRLTDALFHFILRHALLEESGPSIGRALYTDGGLTSAIEAIESAPQHPWRVEELADHAGLSRAAFSRRFKQATGVGPHEYLTRIRMLKALVLLRDRGETVDRVAAAVGYRSPFAFSRRFKQLYGRAPSRQRASEVTGG
ncbi:MAG: AraC family transcriptional regulator [Spirochaetes bacterium]|jgi:AraC-like DNA-binding protein|nr:AraC family transcriptional regulator [Spirochaetota bacterium]